MRLQQTKRAGVASALMVLMCLTLAAQVTIDVRETSGESSVDETLEKEKHPGGFDFSLSVLGASRKHEAHTSTFEVFSGGLSLGFIHGVDEPQNVALSMGRSIELGWTDVVGLGYNINPKNALSVGFGLLWRNYRMTSRYRFLPSADGTIAAQPYPEGANPSYSRLHTLHMTLPLHYLHRFNRGFKLMVGPEFAFNAGANRHTRTIKTRYTLDGQPQREMYRHVHAQPSMVHLTASVAWKQLGFYARYTPSSAFDTDYGPRLHSFSVGFMLFGF